MQLVLIANPRAGRGKGRRVLASAKRSLEAAGHVCRVRLTDRVQNGRAIAREEAGRADALVVLGGDGSLFEVVNGVMDTPHRPLLAQIPVGTGNSFIKDLGIENAEDGVSAVLGGKTRRVDLGRVAHGGGEFHFINLTGSGFVARVARLAHRFKFLGSLSYSLAVLLLLPPLKSGRLELTADGVPSARDALFVEICNSRKTGGDMIMAPDAQVDDGLFDVVVAKAMGRLEVLALFPKIFSGRHVESPLIECFKCRELQVRFDPAEPVSPDGELLGDTPLTATVLPGALELFCL